MITSKTVSALTITNNSEAWNQLSWKKCQKVVMRLQRRIVKAVQQGRWDFPTLPSYDRFIALKPRVLWYLAILLQWLCGQAKETGISYIDSTPIATCHRKRISKNKVFAGIAEIGKSTYGWFYGFKLHMVINEKGEIQGLKGNVDDRKPAD
ncbi:PDZ domain-containing protein [Trichonephila inaurata madagascariensis]|uniref:PDZ domain-containing protein n=1 Tax=Trichonephila inaurata madagascariensis TaxID=2747483 RepID=A0A8X6Y4G1_9ARAC|nr:PDZ domain-containing protein [Trichonephila inaurata madagascariensis]